VGGGHPDGKKVLQRLARETGGGFFEVTKKEPIETVFARIQEELRNQYSIGYVSDRPQGGGFRRLHLTAGAKDAIVQTRDGYYADAR
jgi:VWFA-related protein